MDYYELIKIEGVTEENYNDFTVLKVKIGEKTKTLIFNKEKEFQRMYYTNLSIEVIDESHYIFIDDVLDLVFIISFVDGELSIDFYYRSKEYDVYSLNDTLVKEGFIILHTINGDLIFNLNEKRIETPSFDFLSCMNKGNCEDSNKIFFKQIVTSDEYKNEITVVTIKGTFEVESQSLVLPTVINVTELNENFNVLPNDDSSFEKTKKEIIGELNKKNKEDYKDRLLTYEYDTYMLRRKKKNQR